MDTMVEGSKEESPDELKSLTLKRVSRIQDLKQTLLERAEYKEKESYPCDSYLKWCITCMHCASPCGMIY